MSSGRPLRAGPVGGHLRVTVIAISFALLPAAAHSETIEEKAQVCAACHGENGVPPEQAFPVPVIWGQNLGYLFFQLRDFKSGARKNDVAFSIASFSGTPVDTIREAINESDAILRTANEPAGLAAVC